MGVVLLRVQAVAGNRRLAALWLTHALAKILQYPLAMRIISAIKSTVNQLFEPLSVLQQIDHPRIP